MNELVEASLSFPTVVFTIALGIALFYWLFVLLGALDIDLLGGGDAAGDGIGDAGGDAGGGGDGHDGGDLDGGHGVWSALGLGSVPLTISVSVILLVCWCGSLLAMHYLGRVTALGSSSLLPVAVLLGVLIVGLPLAGLLVRPLAPVFRMSPGKSQDDYVGHLCTISTGYVDAKFGQAVVEDKGGTVMDIQVRCDREGVLARGHKALILEYDRGREAYVVEPTADMLSVPSGTGEPA